MAESRRLAAILAADIAGYSALIGADEARTVGDLKGHQAVVLPMVGMHGGRIIDTAGDGILAEFARVVNAQWCSSGEMQCDSCDGLDSDAASEDIRCRRCGGKGYVRCTKCPPTSRTR